MLSAVFKKKFPSFLLDIKIDSDSGTLGILGKSGAGKSITLKCIAGLLTPDEGRIVLNGKTLFDSDKKINLPPQKRKAGYLFQNNALFPNMTVLENILAPAYKMDAAQKLKDARSLIERFGLSHIQNNSAAKISGGEQQRCALARLMMTSPELLMLDEPFSALDSELREKMQLDFAGLLSNIPDAILVTHSRDEAYKLCREIAVLENARISRQDAPDSLFASPRTVSCAVITGCKNITPVKKIADNEVHAPDWGLNLKTVQVVDADVTHIGIRAHDFVPLTESRAYNVIEMRIEREMDEPFEKTVLFTNAKTEGSAVIWWKVSKYIDDRECGALFVPPEKIMLLRQC